MKGFSLFLVIVALITGIMGCSQTECTPMVAAGSWHTAVLESDGTVVAVGDSNDGQCDIGKWNLITERLPVSWVLLLFEGTMAAAVAVGLVYLIVCRRRRLKLERRETLGEPEGMSGRVSFLSKIGDFLCNPATTFRRQMAKDSLWLLLYPVYHTISTIKHEGSHALAAIAEGAHIEEFVFWPTPGHPFLAGYVRYDGHTTWFTTAAPYFCELITFFVAFLIVLIAKPKPRWLWFNILIIGMLSPFINSLANYAVGVAGYSNDIGRLLVYLDPLAVHLFFGLTCALFAWGMYYCYFRKRHQV